MHNLDPAIWEPELAATAERAVRRVIAELEEQAPKLADQLLGWLALRCDILTPENYFLNPQGLPLLALPWWLERSIQGKVDLDFQADLMYSSVNLYYSARMLDDLMDGHAVDPATLPGLYPFYLHFQGTYFKHFEASDDFWRHFERMAMTTAEVTSVDHRLEQITEADYAQFSARKTLLAAAPLVAVCFRYGRPELLAAWENIFAVFGRWHQMRDDLLDWSEDWKQGSSTWILSEAERRKSAGESVPLWMGREGFACAADRMQRWMDEMVAAAAALGSPELMLYLSERGRSGSRQIDHMRETAATWAKLLALDTARV
jgi:hypothetical protein